MANMPEATRCTSSGGLISGGSARMSTRIAAPQQPHTAHPTITHTPPRNTIASTLARATTPHTR